MWYWGQQEAAGLTKFLNQSIASYEAAHPNVTIKPVLQSTDNLMPNFAAAAKAKKGPDIEYRWGGDLGAAGRVGRKPRAGVGLHPQERVVALSERL